MFKKAQIYPTIPASDLERAKAFYVDKLGLEIRTTAPDGSLLLGAGDSIFCLYPTQFAGTAEHTCAAFSVEDVEQTVSELQGKGIVFEEYDFPGLKTVNGIASLDGMKSAWFKDTEGNIMAVAQTANVLA